MQNVRVVDIYWGDDVEGKDCVAGFTKAKEAGLWGCIHKASQGTTFKDKAYDRRREAAQKDRKSTRLNSSHTDISRMPSSA